MSRPPKLQAVPKYEGAERLERVSPFLVVVGTDTGVGKTVVAAAIARALTQLNLRVVAVKPVETGCESEISPNEDGAILAAATGQAEPRAALLRLRTPVTPALAADAEKTTIDFDDLVARIRLLAAGADIVIVETAGGLYSPITWQYNALHLVRALEARVLLVCSDRLGAISHVLLTLGALADEDVAGLVFSEPEQVDLSTGTNLQAVLWHAGHLRMPNCDDPMWRWLELPRVEGVEEASRQLDPLAVRLAGDLGLV